MSNPSSTRRALGPGAARALGPQRPPGHPQPPWAGPAAVPDPPARPDAPQPAPRPAEQAVDAIAALRHVRTPAAVLESALHLAQALLARPGEDPLLLEAAEGLAAVIPQYLPAARTPAPTPPAPPVRLRPAPEPTVSVLGTLRA
ncbi:hypothetical protein ACFC1R_31270 [Kitasatospora sp. NPDC056138]|uniref:hypothetical protein n=1 Tax=Kitasatospora sp. NPDC056138 TaxID=3345724 RepID=UPI0035D6FC6D